MGKELSSKQFYSLIGAKTSLNPKTVARVWNCVLEIIGGELSVNGHITLDNFGRFDLVKRGGKDEWVINDDGIKEKRYVGLFDFPSYQPSTNFVNKINTGEFSSLSKSDIMSEGDAINASHKNEAYDIARQLLDKKKKKS